MSSILNLHLALRTRVDEAALARKLRRAGYADGERRPRHTRYWANR